MRHRVNYWRKTHTKNPKVNYNILEDVDGGLIIFLMKCLPVSDFYATPTPAALYKQDALELFVETLELERIVVSSYIVDKLTLQTNRSTEDQRDKEEKQ